MSSQVSSRKNSKLLLPECPPVGVIVGIASSPTALHRDVAAYNSGAATPPAAAASTRARMLSPSSMVIMKIGICGGTVWLDAEG